MSSSAREPAARWFLAGAVTRSFTPGRNAPPARSAAGGEATPPITGGWDHGGLGKSVALRLLGGSLMADEPRRSFHAPPESTFGMVVKASTKPWPRRLGSSIIRALPPRSQDPPSQVRSNSIPGRPKHPKSNNWLHNPKYLLATCRQCTRSTGEHAGHAAAAFDRGTSSTPSRGARAAIAPNDDVQLVAASPLCSSLLVEEHGGGEAVRLDFFVRCAVAFRCAACEPSVPQLPIAARAPRLAQDVASSLLPRVQGGLVRWAAALRVPRSAIRRPRTRWPRPSRRAGRARPRTLYRRSVRASARPPRPGGPDHVCCAPFK